jgi:hypothetical protein
LPIPIRLSSEALLYTHDAYGARRLRAPPFGRGPSRPHSPPMSRRNRTGFAFGERSNDKTRRACAASAKDQGEGRSEAGRPSSWRACKMVTNMSTINQ